MKSNKVQEKLQEIFLESNYDLVGVGLCKEKNKKKIDGECIAFRVKKKKPLSELDEEKVIPKTMVIDGKEYITDVIEQKEAFKLLACYPNSSDSEIQRLQGNPNLLTPMKGGQEIVMFPTGWVEADPPGTGFFFSVGTLGFFAVDNTDDRLVGVTNAHVVCNKKVIASDRTDEAIGETYNTIEEYVWPINSQPYQSGAVSRNGSNPLVLTCPNIKRYSPFKLEGPNFTDIALLIMNPSHIDTNSYRINHPTTEVEYTDYMPFATTEEINDLLTLNPRLYSVGRTTGPKGWEDVASCRLRVVGVNVQVDVSDPEVQDNTPDTIPFNDTILFQYEDESNFPIAGGDSGSVVFADIGGEKKIIGVAFAGGENIGVMCRIDRVTEEFNIRAWDNTYVLDESTPLQPVVVKNPISDPTSSEKEININSEIYYQVGTSDSP